MKHITNTVAILMLVTFWASSVAAQPIEGIYVGPAGGNIRTTANWELLNGDPVPRRPSEAGDIGFLDVDVPVSDGGHWDGTLHVTGNTLTIEAGGNERRYAWVVDGAAFEWVGDGNNSRVFGRDDGTVSWQIEDGGMVIRNLAGSNQADFRWRGAITGTGNLIIDNPASDNEWSPVVLQRISVAHTGDTIINRGRLILIDHANTSFLFSFQNDGDTINRIYADSPDDHARLSIRSVVEMDVSGFDWDATAERSWQLIDWSGMAGSEFTASGRLETGGTAWGVLDPTADPFSNETPGTGRVWTYSDGGLDWTFDEAAGELSVIPEPSTMVLLVGAMLVGLARWRRMV